MRNEGKHGKCLVEKKKRQLNYALSHMAGLRLGLTEVEMVNDWPERSLHD